MADFPLTPAEAIAVAAELTTHPKRLPHWQGWVVKLRDWGRAELAAGADEDHAVADCPDSTPSDIDPNVIHADVTHNPWIIACDGGVSSTPDKSARSREIWRETAALLAAEAAKRPHIAPGEREGFVGGPIILDETTELTPALASAVAARHFVRCVQCGWPTSHGVCGQCGQVDYSHGCAECSDDEDVES